MKMNCFKLMMSMGLLTTMSFSAIAGDYYCKNAYQEKLQKIEDNRLMRNIGKSSLIIGVIAGGIIVPVSVFGMGITGAAIITPLFTAPAGQGLADIIDREKGLKLAKEFIELSQVDRDLLKEHYYQEFVTHKIKEITKNTQVEPTRVQVEISFPKDEFKLYTLVDSLLDSVNKKRKRNKLNELSYIEFQEVIQKASSTDEFCEKRPETLRKIKRILLRSVGN